MELPFPVRYLYIGGGALACVIVLVVIIVASIGSCSSEPAKPSVPKIKKDVRDTSAIPLADPQHYV
jgi:hypothetical protein